MSRLFTYVNETAPLQLKLLERLVNIDSGTASKAGVDEVGAVLAAEMEALGLAVERVAQESVGDHVVARKPGTTGHEVLLVGHMDTVYPEGTAAERPFRVDGDRAYGPGIYDMKGGLVVLVYALKALRETAPETWAELGIRVIFNSDEETGSDTSRDLIAREAKAVGAACVLEPSRPGGEYVRERKGVGMFRLAVTGKSAHAGAQPELGANAIADLAHKVCALSGLTDYGSGLTINVGAISGGGPTNVVPAHAEAGIDIRVTTLAMMEEVEAKLREIAATVHVPGTTATLTGMFKHKPMEFTPATQHLFTLLEQAGRDVGFEVRNVASGGGSDGNNTSQHVPTLDAMGPRGSLAHSPNEYVEVDSFPQRTKALARFLQLWLADRKA